MDDREIAELAGGLRTAVSRLAHELRRPGAERGVTPTRLSAMVVLERHGPLRAGDLADRLHITAASMSRLAEVLLAGGWVGREPDPADRRASLLHLTAHGKSTLADLRRESTGELAEALRTLPDDQRRALAAALPVLEALADRQRAAVS